MAFALLRDVCFPFIRTRAKDRDLIWIGRFSVLLIAFFAQILALNLDSIVFSIVAYAWTGFVAAFGPALFVSHFWKRATRKRSCQLLP
jgi:sodium/proline symporter